MKTIKPILLVAFLTAFTPLVVGCNDANVASHNLSKDADNFKINRRTVFYNGINGEYILEVDGYCSIQKDKEDKQLELTCKTGDKVYKKHYLGISDNVTYFSEQLDSTYSENKAYKVVFKPSTIIPDVEIH